MRGRRRGVVLLLLLFLVVVLLAMAMVFIRVSAFWFLMPAWLDNGIAGIIHVESQERAADVEFLAAWVLCFVLLAAVVIAATVVRRLKIRKWG